MANPCLVFKEEFLTSQAIEGKIMEGQVPSHLTCPIRVLIVDDEPDTVTSTAQLLSMSGFQVLTAADGFEALEQVSLHQPHVVVLDLVMPGFSGLSLARRICDS